MSSKLTGEAAAPACRQGGVMRLGNQGVVSAVFAYRRDESSMATRSSNVAMYSSF